VPRLRRSNPAAKGITRARQGSGWVYAAPDGSPVTDATTIERCDALVLPPAWEDVWICPWPQGHIQALGTDARGRRQYRYHPDWTAKQALAKFDRALAFAETLPRLRVGLADDLTGSGLGRDRVMACAVRLLDLGFFRVGNESYAEDNGSYGLATIRRDHVTVSDDDRVEFAYVAKSGKDRHVAVVDPAVVEVIRALLERDDPDPELLAWQLDDGAWHDVKAADVNAELRARAGGDFSAKDFRTWSATVLTAVALAVSEQVATSPTARKRAISRAVAETATYLGNTPTVCRASYVHPDIIDRYADGLTVSAVLGELGADTAPGDLAFQGPVEAAVLELLTAPHRRHRRAAA